MAASFYHGVEIIEILKGPRPVNVVASGVIALVGCAPAGPRQTLTQVLNDKDAAQFGSELPGFNIPEALNILIGAYGAAPILVVNVFDPATHLATVTDEAKTVGADGKFRLAHAALADLVITTTGGGPVTLVKDTDYTVDNFGRVQILTRVTYPDGTALLASYKRFNPSLVTGNHIVGTVGAGNVRTGMKLFENAIAELGYKPKLLIAPRYTSLSSVAAELAAQAVKFAAVTFIDAPIATTPQAAITGRGPSGTINFNTSNERVELCYLHQYRTDPNSDVEAKKLVPLSVFAAGLQNWVDNKFGFWFSKSNKVVLGSEGVEMALAGGWEDPNGEPNLLNAAGISTTMTAFGTGIRYWGNRSSSYPVLTHPVNFVSVRRIVDIAMESVKYANLQFLDLPGSPALIDEITETVNRFFNTLIGRGALIQGSYCYFDPADNDVTELAAGHYTFTCVLMGATPAERITFKSVLDVNLLKNLAKS